MEEDLDSMEILIDIAPNGDVVLVCGGSVGHEANGEYAKLQGRDVQTHH